VDLTEERAEPLSPPAAPVSGRAATPRATLAPLAKGTVRLLANWGVLIAAVAVVLMVRHHAEAQARAPLPPPKVHLLATAERQWQTFPAYRGEVPVLLYHGITASGTGLSVTPQFFAEQMLALRTAGFHAITLSQYVRFVHGDHHGLPAKPILLTFDDGRLGTFRAANDILRMYGFHATMFLFASWPTVNPGSSPTWNELRSMSATGIWSVQENGGSGHESVVYNTSGDRGNAYAYRQYTPGPYGGQLEGLTSFLRRATSNILWGERQFAANLPGYRPLAFAVPYTMTGKQQTNDPRIPPLMFSWLQHKFSVVFGGDYLGQTLGRGTKPTAKRLSHGISYRVSVSSRTSFPELYCRLRDWAIRKSLRAENECLQPPSSGDAGARAAHAGRQIMP
jgi:hypothetical protein